MKSLTQIIGAIVLSSFLTACPKTEKPPQLKNWTFVKKIDGVIQVDYLEYYKSIFAFEREIIANLYLRPQDTQFSEDYPKVVLDVYLKNNEEMRTFIDYDYQNNSAIVDEYWDGEHFFKRNKDNESTFQEKDKEYTQLLELIKFKEKVAKKIRE